MTDHRLDPTLLALEQNAVVAASAGTGKTHLITNVYLGFALGLGPDGHPVPAERIAATTFSRAAAREIRERLELRLAVLAGEAPAESGVGLDAALSELAARRGLSERELRTRAKRALAELPRTAIDTLHGLAARLLRTHALALDLPPGFTILEEQAAFEDVEATLDDVLTLAIEAGGERERAALALIDAAHGLENARAGVRSLLALLDEEGLDADTLSPPEHTRDARTIAETLRGTALAIRDHGAEHPGYAGALDVLGALATEPPNAERLEAGLLGIYKPRQKLDKLPCAAALERGEAVLLGSGSRAKRVGATVRFLASAEALDADARAILALVGEVQRALRVRRRARGALGFGDLIRLARDGLLARPDIQARAADELDVLLVDEFQDTSRVQRDLVLLLCQASEAARRRTPGALPDPRELRPRGLVVVGDRKQSIYAFRGADVSVYARFAAELAGQAAADALDLRGVRASAEPVARFVALRENRRSAPGILRFVNAVSAADFADAPERSYEIRYTAHEALVPPADYAGDPGRVTVVEDDGSQPENDDPVVATAEGGLRTAFVVAGVCARIHAEGTPLREIAVLARRRATLPLVELALDRLGIPFVVSGRALYATPEVRDLCALLRLALDPHDRHALAVVARSPLGGLSDPELVRLARPGRGLLPAALWQLDGGDRTPEEQRLVRELRDRLLELHAVAPRLSPRDALAFAVERFELEAVLGALPRGAARFGNVGRLLEIAARHGGSLPRFVRWLERQIALEVDESEAAVFSEDDEAVRLVTIHASKGLAFGVTVLADANSTEPHVHNLPLLLFRHDDRDPEIVVRHRGPEGTVQTPLASRFNKDARARAFSERQRLSYVALTRARRELCIVLPPTKPRGGSLAESIHTVLAAGSLAEEPTLRRLSATELLTETPAGSTSAGEPLPPPPRPAEPPFQSVVIGVTALADFSFCPRRFQLLHVLGLEEPSPRRGTGRAAPELARALGSAAHRVLERFPLERWGTPISETEIREHLAAEGLDPDAPAARTTSAGIRRFLESEYARSVQTPGVRVHRERELTVTLELAPASSGAGQLALFSEGGEGQRAVLKATLDLVIERPDGTLEILDYKRTRGGDAARYAPQLHAYRVAARHAFDARSVRAGLVHLLAGSGEPEWLEPTPLDLPRLVTDLVRKRYRGDYPGVSVSRCRALRCGFLSACHPEPRSAEATGARATPPSEED